MTTTQPPAAWIARISATVRSRENASRPLVGSSASSTGAPPANATAAAARCAMPPESCHG